jgi:hypothetical protein
MLARVRLFTAVEEHGSGKQLTRVRSWPSPSLVAGWLIGPPAALAVVAALTGATGAAVVLAAVALVLALGAVAEATAATGEVVRLHRGEPARRRARGRALADSRQSSGG